MKLSKKELALIVQFLDQFADELGNNGCNDWDFPEDWTEKEQKTFVKQYHAWNGDPEEFDEEHLNLPDFAVVGFLKHKIEKEIK